MVKKVKKVQRNIKDDECCQGNKSPGALFIPAGVILGVGTGFFVNNIPGGTLVGLGFGFLAFAIYEISIRIKK